MLPYKTVKGLRIARNSGKTRNREIRFLTLQRSLGRYTAAQLVREDAKGSKSRDGCVGVAATRFRIVPLDPKEVDSKLIEAPMSLFMRTRQRVDEGVGCGANLAQGDLQIFPPGGAWSAAPGRDG